MKWIIAPVIAAPMMVEAVMGPDLWFKFTFAAGGLLMLVLILLPERELAQDYEEEMPLYMDKYEVIAFRERRAQRVQRRANHVRIVKP